MDDARLKIPAVALGIALVAAPVWAEQANLERARELLIEAKSVAGKMFEAGPRNAMIAEVAGMQARAGDRQAALATAAPTGNRGWKAVAKGFADAGDVASALDAARKVVEDSEFGRFMPGHLERDDAMQEIALRSARRRDFQAAARAIREIGDPAITAGAYAGLAEAQVRAGDHSTARGSFNHAESAARRAQFTLLGSAGHAYAYTEIGKAHGRLGDRLAAIAAFDKALAAARRVDSEYRKDNIIAGIAAARAEAGDFEGAFRTLKEMRNPQQSLKARVTIARSLADAGRHDRATETAAATWDHDTEAAAFAAIGTIYFRRGEAARAAQAFERAVAAAEKRPSDQTSGDFSFRDSALLDVARGQALAGDREGALRTSGRIVRRGPNADNYINDAVYGALATGQATAGDSEAALRTLALIKVYPPPREMWRAVGGIEGRRGNVDAALARGPGAGDETRRAELLMGLAEGLIARAGAPRQP